MNTLDDRPRLGTAVWLRALRRCGKVKRAMHTGRDTGVQTAYCHWRCAPHGGVALEHEAGLFRAGNAFHLFV
jgi:hypothetical protein